MIMADVLKYVLLVLGALVVIVSYWLVSAALFPVIVDRARTAYGLRPWRITLVGLAVTVPLLLLGVVLLTGAPNAWLKVLGGVVAGVPFVLGLAGSAGLAERVGHGLVHADDTRSPWRRSLRGGAVLALAFLLPVVGWFVVLPWVLCSGCGATVLAMRTRRGTTPIELASAA